MTTAIRPTTKVYFEQPLNDHMRISLRLEHLFLRLHENILHENNIQAQAAITALVRIFDVIDRPDLKSKLTHALNQIAMSLAQLKQYPQVDQRRLRQTLDQLDEQIRILTHEKIAETIRNIEFLKKLRSQLNNPGGPCNFKSPCFKLWLQLPTRTRVEHLKSWHQEFQSLENIVKLILQITRESAKPQTITCYDGFYHQTLDQNLPCELVRVALPANLEVYPEISAGRHRLSIRFLKPNFLTPGTAKQINEQIEFDLSCCRA